MALWAEGNKSVHELGQMLQLHSGILSPLRRRLKTSELVERKRIRDDNRIVTSSRSPRAVELREELAHIAPATAQATGPLGFFKRKRRKVSP